MLIAFLKRFHPPMAPRSHLLQRQRANRLPVLQTAMRMGCASGKIETERTPTLWRPPKILASGYLREATVCFVCCQAVGLFVSRTRTEKIMARCYRQNLSAILDCHHMLWPGEPVCLLKPKQGEHGEEADTQTGQKFWTRECTMPTSMVMAYVLFALGSKNRTIASKVPTSEALAGLVTLFASTLGGFKLPHMRLGDGQSIVLEVDAAGHIEGSEFWTPQFYRRLVQVHWQRDVANEKKKWLKSSTGNASVPLVEILCFCLDAQRTAAFQRESKPDVLSLMTHVAHLLDQDIGKIRVDMEEIPAGHFGKNKRRLRMHSSVLVETLANRIWSGEDGCFLAVRPCAIMVASLGQERFLSAAIAKLPAPDRGISKVSVQLPSTARSLHY